MRTWSVSTWCMVVLTVAMLAVLWRADRQTTRVTRARLAEADTTIAWIRTELRASRLRLAAESTHHAFHHPKD